MTFDPVVSSLAYIGFTSPAAGEWSSFGPDILGLELVDPGPDGAVRLRVDDVAWRIAVHHGDTDDLAYLGWSVDGPEGMARAVEAVGSTGTDVHTDDAQLAAARDAEAVAWFTDPFGFRHELAHGRRSGETPFAPSLPGVSFVTGDAGLGHAVLVLPDLDVATDFYIGAMRFGHSDDVDVGVPVRFLHCNPRHHSLAFSAVPGVAGFHHLMLEVTDPDEVGRAHDRVQEAGLPLAMGLGRHTNDRMFSFYVRSPSGFEVEYGAGGLLIDTTEPWTTGQYDAGSAWGHRPPAERLLPGMIRPVAS